MLTTTAASATKASHARAVRAYYHTFESIIGYRLMKGVKHCGYHPDPEHPLSLAASQLEQDDLVGRMLAGKSGDRVLECGCGEGSAANYIAKKYGYQITGLDLLPLNITRAHREAKREGNNNTFVVGDYMDLPFPDNSFDAVYAMETLVHALNANELFSGIFRVLKPGGKLVFCEYSMTPREMMNEAGKRTMTIIDTACPMPALEQFTTGAFPGILKKAGFTDVDVTDITEHIKPSVVKFYRYARWPMQIIKRLHLERQFVGAYSAYALYLSHTAGEDLMQYNLVTARKPSATGKATAKTGMSGKPRQRIAEHA